jgi:hypothetical protein
VCQTSADPNDSPGVVAATTRGAIRALGIDYWNLGRRSVAGADRLSAASNWAACYATIIGGQRHEVQEFLRLRFAGGEFEGFGALAFVHTVEDGAVVDQETGGGGVGGPKAGEYEVVAEDLHVADAGTLHHLPVYQVQVWHGLARRSVHLDPEVLQLARREAAGPGMPGNVRANAGGGVGTLRMEAVRLAPYGIRPSGEVENPRVHLFQPMGTGALLHIGDHRGEGVRRAMVPQFEPLDAAGGAGFAYALRTTRRPSSEYFDLQTQPICQGSYAGT